MATRILLAAARGLPAAAFRSAFPALAELDVHEANGWSWAVGSLWGLSTDDVDPSAVDAPVLLITTADDALWFLRAAGPGREPFGIVHWHVLLGPNDDDPDDDDDEPQTFRDELVELYEMMPVDVWPPAAVKELAGETTREATPEYLRLQAEATADALTRLGIPHDREAVLGCLTGATLSEEQLEDSLGNLPPFLACLGIDLYLGQAEAEDEEPEAASEALPPEDDAGDAPAEQAGALVAAAEAIDLAPLDAPVELPLAQLHHLWLAVWACDPEGEVVLVIEGDDLPEIAWPTTPLAADANNPRASEDASDERVVRATPGRIELELMWGSVWRRERWLQAIGAALAALPAGARLLLGVVPEESDDEDDAPVVGPFGFRGSVANGTWTVTHTRPAMPAEVLRASLALMGQAAEPGPVPARSEEEALAALAAAEKSVLFMELPKLEGKTALRADDDKHNLLAVFLRLRYAEHWPFEGVAADEAEQAEFTEQLKQMAKGMAERANPELADAEVIFDGAVARYLVPPAPASDDADDDDADPLNQLEDAFLRARKRFLIEFLGEDPAAVEAEHAEEEDDEPAAPCADPAAVKAALPELGFTPLGEMICDKFADVRLAGFARPGPTWAVTLKPTFGDLILELYTDLDDGSSLTSSSNPATADAPHKKIFRRPYPDATPAQLLENHERTLAELSAERGASPVAIDETLTGLAKALDAFLQRELG